MSSIAQVMRVRSGEAMGSFWARRSQDLRDWADHIERLERDRDALLAAAESALQWMALNTPFPLNPDNPDPMFDAMADAMDKQRERLRAAIRQAQPEPLTAEEQSYRDLAASGGIVDAP